MKRNFQHTNIKNLDKKVKKAKNQQKNKNDGCQHLNDELRNVYAIIM